MTVGMGLTVMVKVSGFPEQVTPLFVKNGVTANVLVNGFEVLLVVAKAGTLPVPEFEKRPMAATVLFQE